MVIYYRATVRKSGMGRLVAATAVVILVILLDILSGGKVRAEIRAGAATLSRWSSALGSHVWGSGIFTSRAALESQNAVLAAQLSDLSESAGMAATLQQQNDQLRALVHLAAASPGLTAPVVSSLSASPYGTFLIGVGGGESVSPGDLVLTEGGFVIGRVSHVGAGTALVAEIFAPGASQDAVIDGTSVTLSGSGGGNAQTEVPRGLVLAVGDPVVVPEFGQRPVGIVGAVASTSASASQQVYVRLPSNLSALQFVYVTPPNN